MTQTISRLYNSYPDAHDTVLILKAEGVPEDDISIVSGEGSAQDGLISSDTGAGAGLGGMLGVAGGVLAGLGMVTVPGLQPIVAAGWLATTGAGAVAGALTGALAGGLVGLLSEHGISPDLSRIYSEGVDRGATLILVRTSESEVAHVQAVLARHAPVDLPPVDPAPVDVAGPDRQVDAQMENSR
jgi:hypothetical protein